MYVLHASYMNPLSHTNEKRHWITINFRYIYITTDISLFIEVEIQYMEISYPKHTSFPIYRSKPDH